MGHLLKGAHLIFLIFVIFSANLSHGQGKSRAKNKENKKKTSSTSLQLDQEEVLDGDKKINVVTSYDFSYDTLEYGSEKTVGHGFSLLGIYSLNKNWTLKSSIGLNHLSSGGRVFRENDSDNFHQISNLRFGVSDRVKLESHFLAAVTNSLFISLPTSERSRVDQHRFGLSFSNNIRSQAWNGLSFFNRFGVSYLSHRQKFSFFNDDRMNRDWFVRNGLGFSYQAFSHLAFSASARINSINYLDDTWESSFGSSFTVLTHLFGVQFYASIINNSYFEDRYYDFNFYDNYRRIVVGGVSYVF